MQIKCGQCGTLHDLEKIPGVESVRCAHCGHYVGYLDMSKDPPGPGTVCEGRFDDDTEGFAQQARQQLRDRMLVVCAHCRARIRVAKRLAGHVIRCTACSKELSVPDEVAEDQVDISYVISPSDVVMGQVPHVRLTRRQKLSQHRRKVLHQQHVQLALKVLGGLMLTILLGSVIWRGADTSSSSKDYISEPTTYTEHRAPEASSARQTETPTAIPTQPDATSNVSKTPAPPTVPAASLAGAPAWSAFASGGYYPARTDRLYYTIPVKLSAAGEPLPFNPAASVTLVLAGLSYPCLGEAVPATQLPIQARQRIIELPARGTTTVHLLFELPQSAGRGTLQLGALGELAVTLPSPAQTAAVPEGRFVEDPPRNLKVLLDDPVMAAIQSSAQQELRIQENGTLLDVSIPQAEVIGQARPAGQGAYAVVLRFGPHSIEGVLRFLPDGNRVVLYLSSEPMHQITYRRKDATNSGDRNAPSSENDDESPRFFGV